MQTAKRKCQRYDEPNIYANLCFSRAVVLPKMVETLSYFWTRCWTFHARCTGPLRDSSSNKNVIWTENHVWKTKYVNILVSVALPWFVVISGIIRQKIIPDSFRFHSLPSDRVMEAKTHERPTMRASAQTLTQTSTHPMRQTRTKSVSMQTMKSDFRSIDNHIHNNWTEKPSHSNYQIMHHLHSMLRHITYRHTHQKGIPDRCGLWNICTYTSTHTYNYTYTHKHTRKPKHTQTHIYNMCVHICEFKTRVQL